MSENRKLLEMNVPMWFDGKSINEALFCEDFLRTRQIIFANGAFFTPDGRVTDDLPLRGEIFEELKYCAVNNIPRKISNIIEIMKLAAHVEDFPPEQDRIHLANGTLMLDGTFTEGKPDIVRNRLPVFYRPDTPKPVLWLSFLNGLLYPEDIPTLQEFIGYCLIPSNKGQRMMVIKGNGGEGKSQIGAVLGQMLGSSMKDGSIGKISENRFARADLEHILLLHFRRSAFPKLPVCKSQRKEGKIWQEMTELTVPVQEIWMSQIMTSEMHRHTMSVKKKYTVTKILSRKEVPSTYTSKNLPGATLKCLSR